MTGFSEEDIAREAYRLWEEDGRPFGDRADDHWFRAIENLRRERSAARHFGNALMAGDFSRGDLPR